MQSEFHLRQLNGETAPQVSTLLLKLGLYHCWFDFLLNIGFPIGRTDDETYLQRFSSFLFPCLIVRKKARQNMQDSGCKNGDNLLQRETIYSEVYFPWGSPTLGAHLFRDRTTSQPWHFWQLLQREGRSCLTATIKYSMATGTLYKENGSDLP